jgi:hypothetical protein
VRREHVDRQTPGEGPPDRIDPGHASEQEVCRLPEAWHAVSRHIDHDEAGDDEEQIHPGIAICEQATDPGAFRQVIVSNGQHFQFMDMERSGPAAPRDPEAPGWTAISYLASLSGALPAVHFWADV